jgi:hypothetical protein
MTEVKVDDLGSLCLVGLIIRQILNQNLEKPKNQDRIRRMNLNLVLQASSQVTSLKIKNGEVSLKNGADPEAEIRVKGGLNDFMDLALGRVPLRSVLTGRLMIGGKIYKAYKLLGFLPLILVGK